MAEEIKIIARIDDQGVLSFYDKAGKKQGEFVTDTKRADDALNNFSETNKRAARSFTEINQALEIGKKAFNTVSGLAKNLFSSLQNVTVVEGVERSFSNLQESVGANANETFPALQKATKGLISDFNLMQSANQAVLLGVDDGTGKFDDMAGAALKLGRAMGIDAKQALDSLVVGIGRQSKLVLDNLGVVVKTEEAYKNYAAAIGTSVEKLSEQEKKLAFNEAAFAAISEKAAELTDIQITAGDSAIVLANSFEDVRNEFFKGISSSTELGQALQELSTTLSEIDWAASGKAVGDFIAQLTEIATQIYSVVNPALKSLQGVIESTLGVAVKTFYEKDAAAFEDKMYEINDLLAQDTPEAVKKAANMYKVLAEAANGSVGIQSAFKEELQNLYDGIQGAGSRLGIFVKEVDKTTISTKKLTEAVAGSNGTNEALSEKDKALKDLLKSLKSTAINIDQTIYPAFMDLRSAYVDGELSAEDYERILSDLARGYVETAKDAQVFKENLDDANKSVDEATKKALEGKTALEQFSDGISNFSWDALSEGFEAQLPDLQSSIGDQLASIIEVGLSGESMRDSIRTGVANIGSEIGSALGSALEMGPLGEQLGGMLGELAGDGIGKSLADIGKSKGETVEGVATAIGTAVGAFAGSTFGPAGTYIGALLGGLEGKMYGKLIAKAFFGKHFEVSAREEFAASIQEALKGLPQLMRIGDQVIDLGIDFSAQESPAAWREFAATIQGTTEETAFMNDAFRGFFDNLRTDTAEGVATFNGFLAVGGAFQSIFAEMGLNAQQFGSILGKNVGGELNNLQMLIGALDISQEEMLQHLQDGFLAGTITAKDYNKSLTSIEDLYAKGIPGAIGRTDLALANLIQGGLTSGRIAWDALGDIGAEALEKGITGLDDLQKDLIAAGYDVKTVEQLFAALAQNGITDVKQLADVTVDQTAKIVEAAQDLGFPFEDAADKLDNLKQKLDAIEEDKYVTVYVNYEIVGPIPDGVKDGKTGAGGQGL